MNAKESGERPAAIVTGGGRGIGRAVVLTFAREGYDVAFTYHAHPETARATAQEVESGGARVVYRSVDARDEKGLRDFAGEVADQWGRLDAVVASAGLTGPLGWETPSSEDWRVILETNLVGQYYAVRATAAQLKRSHGSAVLVSSIAGGMAYPEELVYATSKAGTVSLVRSLALALAPDVRVNAVAPGWIRTDMTTKVFEDPRSRAAIERAIPRGRWGEPNDVAPAVLFLASDAARFITGETLVVDGGNLISWQIGRLR